MKRIAVLTALALLGAASGRAQVSPNSRLLQRPERDGAVFTSPWSRAGISYRNWHLSYDFLLGPSFAVGLLDQRLELGARGWFIYHNPDYSADRGGFSDVDLWGKYLVLDAPLLVTVGGLVTLPTGAQKINLPEATGEVNLEGFSALRYYVSRYLAIIGHAGLRYNSDVVTGWSKTEGRFSVGFGGGVIIQVAPEINLLAELDVETERYRWGPNAIAVSGGVEYLLGGGLGFNGGVSIGLDDGSPEFGIAASLNYLF